MALYRCGSGSTGSELPETLTVSIGGTSTFSRTGGRGGTWPVAFTTRLINGIWTGNQSAGSATFDISGGSDTGTGTTIITGISCAVAVAKMVRELTDSNGIVIGDTKEEMAENYKKIFPEDTYTYNKILEGTEEGV